MTRVQSVLIAAFAVLVVAARAQVQPVDDATIVRRSGELLAAYREPGFFSGAVLVARGDQVLFRGAAGLSNLELAAPNRIDTPMRIAGISQLFTAAAVLRLQEQGKLNVRDTVGKLMPTWPAAYHPITIHQLLVGESGIKDVTQMPDFVRSVALPREPEEVAAIILKEAPVAPPGTWARAANSNYHLLAAIIERAAGLAFTEYVRREIIDRAGLRHTRHDDPAVLIAGRAAGYTQSADGLRHAGWFHMGNAVGSANLISTVDDVHTFLTALLGGRIVSSSSLQQMLTPHVPPQKLAGGATTPGVGYGVNVLDSGTATMFVQGGSIGGFQANLNHDRRSGVTVVVLSNIANSSGAFNMVNGLVAIASGRDVHLPRTYTAVTPRPEDLALLAGEWEVPSAFSISADGSRRPVTMTFRVDGQRLFGKSSAGQEHEWFASGPGAFFARYADIQIHLDPATPDRAVQITSGRKGDLRRIRR